MSEKPSNGGKPRVEKLGGDELTTRTRTHYPPEEGFRRFLEAHRTGFFWEMLEAQLAECDAVMGENGWHRTAEKPKNFADDYDADAYSDLWYAGRIGMLCWLVLNSGSRAGLAEVNLARIMEIGILATEWDWRGKYKPLILRGYKNLNDVTEGARQGGVERGKKLAARKQEIISAMKRLMKTEHSVSSAAAAVARNGIGTSATANRQLYHREERRASKMSHSPDGART